MQIQRRRTKSDHADASNICKWSATLEYVMGCRQKNQGPGKRKPQKRKRLRKRCRSVLIQIKRRKDRNNGTNRQPLPGHGGIDIPPGVEKHELKRQQQLGDIKQNDFPGRTRFPKKGRLQLSPLAPTRKDFEVDRINPASRPMRPKGIRLMMSIFCNRFCSTSGSAGGRQRT